MDKVTIIIPIYNVEAYLERCIQSIRKQTYSNIEVLLIDDGSTDESKSICMKYVTQDQRFTYFYKDNGGLSDARNYGLDRASGEYLVFVDSDDFIEPTYIEDLYDLMVATHSDVTMCGFDVVNEHNQVISVERIKHETQVVTGKYILSRALDEDGYQVVVAWNKMYRRSLFKTLRFESDRLYEDEFLNFVLFWDVANVAILDTVEYHYAVRQNSIKTSPMSKKKVYDSIELYTKRNLFYEAREKQLFRRSQQRYCNWMVECFRNHPEGLDKDTKRLLHEKFRGLVGFPPRAFVKSFGNIVQAISGYVSLSLAAKLKQVYKGSLSR